MLRECRTIAVVGLSANWFRPSYFAAKYMQDHGYRIVPVNPSYESVLGQRCYPSLAAIEGPVDMVDAFRKPADMPALAREAVAIGARVLWMQLGIRNEEAARDRARRRTRRRRGPLREDRARPHPRRPPLGGVNTGIVSSRRQGA